MYMLDHPNIIKLYNHIENKTGIYLIMEIAKELEVAYVEVEKPMMMAHGPKKTMALEFVNIIISLTNF